jgi:hypothetical protein
LIRLRLGVLLALAVAFGAISHAPKAMAAAEVHRLNLVISAIPSQLNGGGMNDMLARYNEYPLGDRFKSLDKITMGWLFDAELRYFVRPNFALAAGVGRLKTESKREFQRAIGADVVLLGDVLAVPLHVGGLYYLAPYTQGDFQARAFVGGGLLSITTARARFSTFEVGLPMRGDTLEDLSLGGTSELLARGESSGYYAEFGAHLFFAARYSVMVGAIYRSAVIRHMTNEGVIMVPYLIPGSNPPVYLQEPLLDYGGNPIRIPDVDLGGVGLRMAVGIGF